MSGGIRASGLVGLAALAACATGLAQPPAGPAANLPKAGAPLTLRAGRQQLRVALVADGLTAPWDIVFIPGTSDMLVTESDGIADGRAEYGDSKNWASQVGERRNELTLKACSPRSWAP